MTCQCGMPLPVTPLSRIGSTRLEAHSTMNNGMRTRSKMAEKVRHHKSNRRPTDAHGANDTLRSKPLLGECPPFVDKAFWVNDSIEKKSYMVGSIRDDQHIPTSDFYCLDFAEMKWTNLTVIQTTLWFLHPVKHFPNRIH